MNRLLLLSAPLLFLLAAPQARAGMTFPTASAANTEVVPVTRTVDVVIRADYDAGLVSEALPAGAVLGYDPVATPEPAIVVFALTAVLVGFIVRCRRKGLPFKST